MAFNASLSAPLTGNLKTRGELSVFGLERDNTSYCSAMEGVRGLKAVVRVSLDRTALGNRHEVLSVLSSDSEYRTGALRLACIKLDMRLYYDKSGSYSRLLL